MKRLQKGVKSAFAPWKVGTFMSSRFFGVVSQAIRGRRNLKQRVRLVPEVELVEPQFASRRLRSIWLALYDVYLTPLAKNALARGVEKQLLRLRRIAHPHSSWLE